MDFDDLLTETVRLFAEHPDVLEHYRHAVQARPGRRVPGHQPGPERAGGAAGPASTATSASSATATSRSTASAAPTSATSSSSRRRSPTPPSSCSSRTTGRPRPSSTPPTPSSPTTSAASRRSCGPQPAGGEQSSATTPRTRTTRPVGRRTRSPGCTTASGHRWGDIAVFYRTNAQSRVLEEQLVRVGIPYKVIGGTRFYDRREVKDALAYLRAVVNPVDEVSLKRVLNVPKRGVGDTTVGRLDAWARGHGLPFSTRSSGPRRRASRAGAAGHPRPSSTCSTRCGARRRRPGRRARGGARRAAATSPSSRPSTPSRRRAASRTWPSWSAWPRSSTTSTPSSRGQPGGRHRRAATPTTRRSC